MQHISQKFPPLQGVEKQRLGFILLNLKRNKPRLAAATNSLFYDTNGQFAKRLLIHYDQKSLFEEFFFSSRKYLCTW
jgi:hypothetical protein